MRLRPLFRGAGRGALVAAIAAAAVVAALTASAVAGGGGKGVRRRPRPSERGAHHVASPGPPAVTSNPPGTVAQPGTPSEQRIDEQLARAESPRVIAALESTAVPAPASSRSFPPVPTADRSDPVRYCTAFVRELLDVDYARQSRTSLLAWAQSEEAPNRLPGVPPSVADKALVASLAGPAGVRSGSSSPVPPAAGWASEATAGTVQSVSDLSVTPSRSWSELLGEGWVPTDPLATVENVTGVLTSHTAKSRARVGRFALTVMLGSARFHPGYGAVAAGAWRVTPGAG